MPAFLGTVFEYKAVREKPMPRYFFLVLLTFCGLQPAFSSPQCQEIFSNSIGKSKTTPTAERTLPAAWQESVKALAQINQSVFGKSQVIEALATAMLAREFVWINGEPGGAKTFLSRMMFEAALNSLPESDKRIFVLQFHKLVSEGKIVGFQKFSSMMKDGKYEIETSTSLVGDQFLYLIADEAEKSNPAVLNSLLSVLNERKAFLGSKVVDSLLSSGVFTSNKTTGEFIQGFLTDRASGEALLDRMAIKIHIANQQLSPQETIAMYHMVKSAKKSKISLPLPDLQELVAKVQIPGEIMAQIVSLAREFDRYVTDKTDKSRAAVRYGEAESEKFPANQFSNRSVRRLVQIFKAGLIAKQLMMGVPFEKMRLTPQKSDLSLIAKSALYIGPSQIELKSYPLTELKNDQFVSGGVAIKSAHGSQGQLQARFSPYDGKIELLAGKEQIKFIFQKNHQGSWDQIFHDQSFNWTVDLSSLQKLDEKIQKLMVEQNIDLDKPQFEVDSSIDQLIDKGTVKERTRNELLSIKEDMLRFAEILNRHFDTTVAPNLLQTEQKILPLRSKKELRTFRREMMSASEQERVHRYYDWMTYEVAALKQRMVELDYSIEAHLTGILAENHLYVFGPPGGAKTALAEAIVKAELKKINADQVDLFVKSTLPRISSDQKFLAAVLTRMETERPKQFERFLLQFHKLLPEGVLIGFPKIEKQLNEGKEELEFSTSLAADKFIFAILDEVDKANPQTITALLSILNEREIFAGNQVFKAALRTAVLTSNKMPSEFLDSYNEDISTGDAVMDRTLNKVFVSNKISTEEKLTQFLMNLENGISPNWQGLLAIGELAPLVKQVQFENPAVELVLAQIHQKFLSLRIKKEEEARKAHKMDPKEFPEYYVSAAGSASDRSFIKLMDQLPARFIIHQLMEGVAYKDLRTTIEMKDLNLFFEGLGYWAPQKIVASYDSNGILNFQNDSHILETLVNVNSGVLDQRVKYHVNMMIDEAKDFSGVLNSVVGSFIQEYHAEISKYPELFPSLFSDGARPGQAASP
jgi:MoxR-like ATPase